MQLKRPDEAGRLGGFSFRFLSMMEGMCDQVGQQTQGISESFLPLSQIKFGRDMENLFWGCGRCWRRRPEALIRIFGTRAAGALPSSTQAAPARGAVGELLTAPGQGGSKKEG